MKNGESERKLIIWIKRIPERKKEEEEENGGEKLINKTTQTNFLKQKADFPGWKSPQSSSQNKDVNIRKY